MQGFARFALRLAPGLLVAWMFLPQGLCVAQAVNTGSVFAPSGWLGVITPVHDRIDLKFFAYYIGELEIPVAQFEVPIRTTKFLTITPGYMYYSVPASGLNKLAPQPGGFTDSSDEHQFRVDGTLTFYLRNLEISARNMYVRRFRPAPADDIGRYRGRIGIAHPLAVMGRVWKPFAMYEAYYERSNGGWNKDQFWGGVTLPLMKQVWFQPSYMWQGNEGIKDIHYLLFGVIIRTRP